jgi:hypothetical protein
LVADAYPRKQIRPGSVLNEFDAFYPVLHSLTELPMCGDFSSAEDVIFDHSGILSLGVPLLK